MARKQTFNSKNQLNKILQDVDTIQGEAIIDEKNKTISAKFNGTIQSKEVIWQMMDLHKNS